MEMIIDFPQGLRVDAHVGKHHIMTDQPHLAGGEDSAPAPFTLFLASIGTCAGIYILSFCRQRNISTDGLRLIQKIQRNPLTGMVDSIEIDIETPPDFPEKYKSSLIQVANLCAVKKHLEKPPQFSIQVK